MMKGQNIAGHPVGILYIEDVHYPMLPGNAVNGYTFDFPVRLKAVRGLTCKRLFRGDESIFKDMLCSAKELEREGVRAISAACGFFGNFQKQLAQAMDIPVAVSSLVQVPWIASIIKPGQKIGVLTANMNAMTDHLLENCGIKNRDQLIIRDLYDAPEFSAIVQDRGEFDNGIVRQEVLAAARQIIEECPDTGAILLECSDMPPYASDIQSEVQLPIFDLTTLIRWLHNSVAQIPYHGFI